MALTTAEWQQWRRQVDQAVDDHGWWLGLANGEGEPWAEFPVTDLDAPVMDLSAEEISVTVPVATTSGSHPLVDALIADGLGNFDSETLALEAVTNRTDLLVFQGPGGWRNRAAYVLDVPDADGDDAGPTELVLEGTHLLGELDWWPCPSVPVTWGDPGWATRQPDGSYFATITTDESGTTYTTPRRLSPIQVGTVARGHTYKGPVLTGIRDTIQDSLDAVNRLAGWSNDPHMIVTYPPEVDTSRTALIPREERTVWETIADTARIHGVTVDAHLWWPGDPAIRRRDGVLWTPDRPITVVTVQALGGEAHGSS